LRHLQPPSDPNLIVGVTTHDDAGVYRLTDEIALVQTVDFFPPVVDDPFVYGQIAAANALSDVYAMGGVPKTALNLVGFPDNELPFDLLGQILAGGGERCATAGVTVVGGHTIRDAEIKFGLAVTGLVHPKRAVTNAGARPGDRLVLTKALGTGVVTTAAKKEACPPDLLAAACASMIALNGGASQVMLAVGAHAATDITGFGLAGHGREMADGSQVTLQIDLARLPVFAGVEEFARAPYLPRASKTNRAYVEDTLEIRGQPSAARLELFFDAQTSGGLLISVAPARADELVSRARAAGAEATCIIGEVLPRGAHALIVT
jgi:selenide, water dikinase